MNRRKTTQAEVLRAVAARLEQTIPGLNKNTILLALEPSPPEFPSHKNFISVCPTEGKFDDGMLDGGGIEQTEEMAGVCVTIFFRTQLDKNNQSENALQDPTSGLLEQKRQVLKHLTCHDLMVGEDYILTEPMMPTMATAPKSAPKEDRLAFEQIYFTTNFVWDLS